MAAPAVAGRRTASITTALILTLALQSAVPPFATDMYTPAFPRVTTDLQTEASLVGLTMTTFFVGMAFGQLLGGPISDQRGRRAPMIIGGLICTLGAVACALSPSIGFLIIARVVQGFGGGMASVVARAVIVDLAQGDRLARVMSIMMAIGGLAPMIAPVAGGAVLTLGGTWRTVFWCLVGFGLLMMITAILVVPESLPPERRHTGGLRQFGSGIASVLRIRLFVAYLLTTAFSGFSMMAYVANSSYVLQVMKGVHPMPFALFFASTALTQVLLSLVNARLVGRFRPRHPDRLRAHDVLVDIGLVRVDVAGLGLADIEQFLGPGACVGMIVPQPLEGVIPLDRAGGAEQAEQPHRRARHHIDHQVADEVGVKSQQQLVDVVDVGIELAKPVFHARERRDRPEDIDQPAQLERHDLAASAGRALGDVEILVALPGVPVGQVLSALVGEGEGAPDRAAGHQFLDPPRPRIVAQRAGRRADHAALRQACNELAHARVGDVGFGEERCLPRHRLQAVVDMGVGRRRDDPGVDLAAAGLRPVTNGVDAVFRARFLAAILARVESDDVGHAEPLQAAHAPLAHRT